MTVKAKPGPKKGSLAASAAGRLGGAKVKEERGLEFFQVIGQKGGLQTKAKHGPAHFSQIGRKGGMARGKKPHTAD